MDLTKNYRADDVRFTRRVQRVVGDFQVSV
jgi:hypothetical protein